MIIRFTVYGEPVPKGRPRFSKTGATYTPRRTAVYEKLVRDSWASQSGKRIEDGEAVRLTLEAVFRVPKSYPKRLREYLPGRPQTKLPDADNIIKSILDGLNGLAFSDDRFVSEIRARKRYGKIPRVEVTLETIDC